MTAEIAYRQDGDLVVEVVAQMLYYAVAQGAEEDECHVSADIGHKGERQIGARNPEQAGPEADRVAIAVEMPESPVGDAFLAEREGRLGGRCAAGAEEQLDERHNHHIRAKVEQDMKHVEQDVHRNLPRIVLQVGQYA